MCGRYTTIKTIAEIANRYQATSALVDKLEANINVSVGQFAPVILEHEGRQVRLCQFGLTPSWAKKKMYLFNARSEGDHNSDNDPAYTGAKGILNKPSFRKPIRSQRCLVIADAFIEGPQDKRLNAPYLIYPRYTDTQFSLAGIWDTWIDKSSGEEIYSFAIVTTTANDLLQRIGHHRSPVILEGEEEWLWLDPGADISDITALLKPFDHTLFNAYPISPEIKSPKAADPSLLKPMGPTIYPQDDYTIYEHIQLLGMGESEARNRRIKSDEKEKNSKKNRP